MTAEFDGAAVAGSGPTVGELFRSRAKVQPTSVAIEYLGRNISYGELLARVERAAAMLAANGLQRGDRVALLSRNRPEYLEIELAAANLGVMTACLNWRLSPRELSYCVDLVSPKLLILEPEFGTPNTEQRLPKIALGQEYDWLLAQQAGQTPPPIVADPEDGLVILYTSGTTGMPKGAIVSHRAMLARALVFTSELGIRPDDTFVAWAPMFHMASTD